MNRGIRQYQAELVTETIQLLIAWQQTLKKEAQAIQSIAQKIADTITHRTAMLPKGDARLFMTTARLFDLVSWHIALPKPLLEKISARHITLLDSLGTKAYFRAHQQNTGARLWVSTKEL